jgi:general secretion pathway protein I
MSERSADGPRDGGRRTRGFTLIEVLAALVIVALGMLGVIEAVTQSARNGTYLREKTLAHWIALNVITEKRLEPEPPSVTESSGDVEFAGQRWRWSMLVTQTQVASLRRMDVSVRPADAPDTSALATVTGFYGTAIGAAGGGRLDWSGAEKSGGSGDGDGDASGDGDKPATPGGSGQPGSPPAGPAPETQPAPEDDE